MSCISINNKRKERIKIKIFGASLRRWVPEKPHVLGSHLFGMVLVIVIKRKGEGFNMFWFLPLTQAFKSTYFLSGKETALSFFFLIKAFGGAPVDTANASNRHSVGVRPD